MSIIEKQRRFVQLFRGLSDQFDKMSYLIALSAKLPEPDDALRSDENRVDGCQSLVWVRVRGEGDQVYLDAFSDTLVIRGILYMICHVVNGEKKEEVQKITFKFLDDCAIGALLEERRTGIGKVIEKIKKEASMLS